MAKEATRVAADLRIPIEKVASDWADEALQSHCRHCLFFRFFVSSCVVRQVYQACRKIPVPALTPRRPMRAALRSIRRDSEQQLLLPHIFPPGAREATNPGFHYATHSNIGFVNAIHRHVSDPCRHRKIQLPLPLAAPRMGYRRPGMITMMFAKEYQQANQERKRLERWWQNYRGDDPARRLTRLAAVRMRLDAIGSAMLQSKPDFNAVLLRDATTVAQRDIPQFLMARAA